MYPSIGIIGGGVVGSATARVWLEHTDVKVYDISIERRTHTLTEVLSQDVLFLCLPTPTHSSQKTPPPGVIPRCDTSAVEDVLKHIAQYNPQSTIAIRSTVPIGFTDDMRNRYGLLNLVHNPEFLTARCAVTDAHLPSRNIIGGELITGPDLVKMYRERFPGVPIYTMSRRESEATKLIQNSFFAVKVAFFNEVRALADANGCNWDMILEGLLSDGRIAHSHTKVPGPDGKYGFGGACLPKDLANLINCTIDSMVPSVVCKAAYSRNQEIDRAQSEPYPLRPELCRPKSKPQVEKVAHEQPAPGLS